MSKTSGGDTTEGQQMGTVNSNNSWESAAGTREGKVQHTND
jgi:hypothetical protein